jgi:hypothetical protein
VASWLKAGGQGTEEKAAAMAAEEEEGEWLSIRQREELALQVTYSGILTRAVFLLVQMVTIPTLQIKNFYQIKVQSQVSYDQIRYRYLRKKCLIP